MKKRATMALILGAAALLAVATSWAYVLTPRGSWPGGATVAMYLQFGDNRITLTDGATSWNDVAATAISMWDRQLGSIDFVGRIENRARKGGDGVNDMFWANDVYGDAFGDGLVATITWSRSEQRIESDVLFNRALSWNSYRGPWRTGLADFRRVALHELGGVLGLGQPDLSGQTTLAIMNNRIGNIEDLQDDDVRGIRALYGNPAQPPPPSLALPSRAEAIDFRHATETRFQTAGVHTTPTFVDIDATAIWNTEYIWYRVNGCDHDAATARVLAQIEGRGTQPVCALIASINLFPSDADGDAFRAALEAEYRDVLNRAVNEYHVSPKSDAVFVSAYVLLRFRGRSHAQASMDLLNPAPTAPAPSPTPTPTPTPAPAPARGKYDGTYDTSLTHPSQGGQETRVFPRFFIVTNGTISSSDRTLSGSVTNETFGNVEFTGPCWANQFGARFTGILNAGSGSKFGEGTFTCNNGAPGGTWRVSNGN